MAEEGEEAGEKAETTFRNSYKTKILPPWVEPKHVEEVVKNRSPKEYTIALSNDNADEWGNITRVGWKGRVDYAVSQYMEERSRALASRGDPFRDPNFLLQATISTIILLASDSPEIPKENVLYAELYLKNIRDENGDHPPNISQFLKHLRYLKKQKNIELEEEYKVLPPESLVLTKISKKSKIPVKINRSTASPRSPRPEEEEEEAIETEINA